MRLHRFYIDQQINPNSQVLIEDPDVIHQIRRVFRMKDGDSVIIFNGTHFDYECKIDGSNRKSIIISTAKRAPALCLDVVATNRSRFQPVRDIYLFAALVKKDKFEWTVEKATELGVTHIIPVLSERSEKKSLNASRLKKIAIEASEQSGRGAIPVIKELTGLESAVNFLKSAGQNGNEVTAIAFHTEGEKLDPKRDLGKDEPIACFIGPEGGWSDAEIDMFHRHDIMVRSLGSQILRAETAVVSALSQVVFR